MRLASVSPLDLVLAFVLAVAAPVPASSACPPAGWDAARLAALKADGFKLDDETARDALALGLVDCLGDPDPAMRDGLAFEAHTHWLRGEALSPATRLAMLERLQPWIAPGAADAGGFRAPFAALVLSEVARTDRRAPWMTPAQRDALVTAAASYVSGVHDYRGYDEREGWRHGVAHGADLLMQLALNPALDKAQLDRIIAAVESQVSPAGHFYIYGEPDRLSRPLLFAAARGLHTEAEWQAFFDRVGAPPADPAAAYSSQAGLARRHDRRAFLLAVYAQARESQDPAMVRLAAQAAAAIAKLG